MLKSRACSAGLAPALELPPRAVASHIGVSTFRGTPLRQVASASRGGAETGFWFDAATFVREWLRHPLDIAAVAPSGKALASLITREIDGLSGAVLELGPGTGVFTRALTRRGVAERDLTLVERSSSFAGLLKSRFPASTILNVDAADLQTSRLQAAQRFGAVVCGLGLRNMTSSQVEGIIQGSFAVLAPTASFYLFTYGGRCSVPDDVLDRLGLTAVKVGSTLRNLPPASVYRLQRIETNR